MGNNLLSRREFVSSTLSRLNFTATPACKNAASQLIATLITEDYELASINMPDAIRAVAKEFGISYDGVRKRLRNYMNYFYQGCPVYIAEKVLGTRFNPEKKLNNEQFYKCLASYVTDEYKGMCDNRNKQLAKQKVERIEYVIRTMCIDADWVLGRIVISALSTMISRTGHVRDVDFGNVPRINYIGVYTEGYAKQQVEMYQKFIFKHSSKKQLKRIFNKRTRLPMNLSKFMRLLAEYVVETW